ncbi:thioredoxin-dependent thiol peroxidase [Tepidiforma flava]|uniref:thioredoxin-dependent peroxiredoxin n=1 Tax=Tepidiforma flava TaxID=3004094 RepID=A0ABY7M7H0_9CHLR|nr:thioredoxin-dependent thiol peroxidase [Tepidiforma flava]WBL36102.1 thioredoxin-dependent thiol peroxidase [Tepidiforma flava]
MSMPDVGAAAPAFSLPDQDGKTVSLADFAGKWVVLYFYPKDDTPGCTKEACSFRDRHAELQAKGAVVLGVSGDSSASHRKFADKYALPFPLLADTEHEVARAYGAWGTKKMYGKEYEGMIRSTVVIDPAGKVAKTWPKVKPDGHGDEVLAWLEANAK